MMVRIKPSNNVSYMDITKGLGIILVVIGHSGSPITSYIYLFHMALFFFISGYFYKEEYSFAPKTLIKRRIKTLYIPFISYEIFFLIFHNVFIKLNVYSTKIGFQGMTSHSYTKIEFIKNFINSITFSSTEELAGTFWFFTVLFTINILFCIISFCIIKFIKNNKEAYRFGVILICFFIGNILSTYNVKLPRLFDITLFIIVIYYLGFLYKKYEENIKLNIFIFIFCFIGLIISDNYGSIDIISRKYTNPIFFIITSLLGIYLTIYVSKYLDKFKAGLLKYVGKCTISIMALQFLAFKIISLIQIKVYGYPYHMLAKFPILNSNGIWWILYSIVGIAVPILIQRYIVDKIKNSLTKLIIKIKTSLK
ncbi:acyltransferase family protein [Clostridium tyrobutyricum]|uniref:acyltransferase family protein n=1 Tax=Clostridium tyrobutyricum TaxID=1519 RepID=UPI0030CAC0D6